MRVRTEVTFTPYLPTPKLKGSFNMPKLVPIIKTDSIEPAILWCPIKEEPLKNLIREIIPLEAIRYESEPEVRKEAD